MGRGQAARSARLGFTPGALSQAPDLQTSMPGAPLSALGPLPSVPYLPPSDFHTLSSQTPGPAGPQEEESVMS